MVSLTGAIKLCIYIYVRWGIVELFFQSNPNSIMYLHYLLSFLRGWFLLSLFSGGGILKSRLFGLYMGWDAHFWDIDPVALLEHYIGQQDLYVFWSRKNIIWIIEFF